MSAIEELWYGNIKPCENKAKTSEEENLTKLMGRHQCQLQKTLNEEQADIFKKYISCSDEYTSLVECEAFKVGFNLAKELLT